MPQPASPVVPLARRSTAARPTAAGGVFAALAWALSGCASVPPVGDPTNALSAPTAPDAIAWPAAYQPEDAAFFVHNAIEISAPPEAVWAQLIDAPAWTSWYRGATNVVVENGDTQGRLASGSSLSWRTMDLDFVSRMTEFVPQHRLSWESRTGLIQGYHAWLIVPTPTGSRVITEESQHGFLAHMQSVFLRSKLRNLHDEWLAGLKREPKPRRSRGRSTPRRVADP